MLVLKVVYAWSQSFCERYKMFQDFSFKRLVAIAVHER